MRRGWEDADVVGASLDLLVEPFERPVPDRGAAEGEELVSGVAEHRFDGGQLPAEHGGDDVELGAHVLAVRLCEDGADRGRDHLGVALGHRQARCA